MPPSPSTLKTELRHAALARRRTLDAATRANASRVIAERLFGFIESLPALPSGAPRTIAGYAPLPEEVDIMPALAALSATHTLALPVVTKDSKVLSFRRYLPGDALTPGAFAIDEPLPSAEEIIPDIAIVPMVAFDRLGHRLGFGRGYYDATLGSFGHGHPVVAVGVAFSVQEVDVIPAESFDRRMHAVITEKELIGTFD